MKSHTKRSILRQIAGFFAEQRKALQYTGLILRHTFSKSWLKRVPEPSALTDQEQHVEDYSRAIHSVMILPYVLVLDMIHRMTTKRTDLRTIDLCCGPGHFTRMLAKNMDIRESIGVDLSEPMLKKAQENAERENLVSQLNYLKSDVAELKAIESNSMDIVSFMDGAHHMNSVAQVTKILAEANRVAKSDGLIILIDPVRPRTTSTANMYHRIAGQPYIDMGLHAFNKDFHDSLLASWSEEEMFQAIPRDTKRKWVQLIPFGFPSFQIVVGLPEGRDELFVSEGLKSSIINDLIPAEGVGDWRMLALSFRLAKVKTLNPLRAEAEERSPSALSH